VDQPNRHAVYIERVAHFADKSDFQHREHADDVNFHHVLTHEQLAALLGQLQHPLRDAGRHPEGDQGLTDLLVRVRSCTDVHSAGTHHECAWLPSGLVCDCNHQVVLHHCQP